MKRIFYYLLIFITISSISVSCSDDLANPRTLTAKKDGVDWKSSFRLTTRGDIPNIGEGFVIAATTGLTILNGEYLMIIIRGTTPRQYNLSVTIGTGIKTECAFVYKGNASDGSSNYVSLSGSVTLTKVDEAKKEISGTFDVVLQNGTNISDRINFTQGKFENLRYINGDISGDAK